MVKKLVILLIILTSFALVGYIAFKRYAPAMIANQLLKETEPAFLPKEIKEKIRKVKAQTKQLSMDVIYDIHRSNITLDQLLKSLDQVTEEEAYLLLDDINKLGKIRSSDQVFDLAKMHFPVEYDVEPLREPFRKKADVYTLERVIQKANEYRDNELIDFESAKSVIKRILIEREKEFNKIIKNN
jgi:hypothetical protein